MVPDGCNQEKGQNERTARGGADLAQRVAKVRHDLRNPLAHILGFSEMVIEKARGQGYNFLKARTELIHRIASEMIVQVNQSLDPKKIESGQGDIGGLQQKLRKLASRVAVIADTLGRKPIVRQDEMLSGDLARIAGAARQLSELCGTALDSLGRPRVEGKLESDSADQRTGI